VNLEFGRVQAATDMLGTFGVEEGCYIRDQFSDTSSTLRPYPRVPSVNYRFHSAPTFEVTVLIGAHRALPDHRALWILGG